MQKIKSTKLNKSTLPEMELEEVNMFYPTLMYS